MVDIKLSDLFKSRANGVMPRLIYLHHDAMDILFSSKPSSFTLNDVVNLLKSNRGFCSNEIIAQNKDRVRLISLRVIEGLFDTKLISKSPNEIGEYVWNLEDYPEIKGE
jgi:hypothetical protein